MYRGFTRLGRALGLAVSAALVLAIPGVAHATADPVGVSANGFGTFTIVQETGRGIGTAAPGYIAPDTFVPENTDYPATIPAGSTADNVAYAGTIVVTDIDGNTASTYCVQLLEGTTAGVNYETGAWDTTGVPNLRYIRWIMLHYFPHTTQPAAAPSDTIRAAAVQAAIWYFSDRFILAANNTTLRPYTSAIVAAALAAGGADEPAVPRLTVTPASLPAPKSGGIVGPFTVVADGPAKINVTGTEVFTDAQGTNRLSDGDTVHPGQHLWARYVSGDDPHFTLERFTAYALGTVFVYDNSNSGRDEAQTLILAHASALVARGGATLEPYDDGSLKITKRFHGSGAGHQGRVVITVTCTGALGQRRQIVLRPGLNGDHSATLTGLRSGDTCTVQEPVTGQTRNVRLTAKTITPWKVTIVTDETGHVTVTDTYAAKPTPVTG